MFSFFHKKTKTTTDLSGLQCDMHSHLVPGIDDGSPDLNTSLHLIKALSDLGYSRLITTPHIYWDIYKNTPETINTGRALVNKHLAEENIPVQLHAAAEYYLDDHVEKLIKENQPLLTLQDKLVLCEFSFVRAPIDWKERIFNLQMNGYQPILAHPERYTYFGANKEIFSEIKNSGCLLQVNILSLTGYYGRREKELAEHMVAHNLVSFLGTDMHHQRHLDTLRSAGPVIMPFINKLLDAGSLMNPALFAS